MIPPSATLIALARQRAQDLSEQTAFTFLVDGETESATFTYADLDRWARAIAVELTRYDLANQRVLLLYQPSLEYIAAFFGCLYAGVVAIPAYPPRVARLERSLPRLQAIVED
ncbi:MAG TPA: AMP-binding protein, partial [Herpetosiphonaceae bacterium]